MSRTVQNLEAVLLTEGLDAYSPRTSEMRTARMQGSPATKNRYNHTASFYEALANLYSFGRIRASKLAELEFIDPGHRVLFAGAGGGEDAIGAAALGAEVTCIDLAPAMVARIRKKLEERGLDATLICGDIMSHEEEGYDAICANYFLNVFAPNVMALVLEHLIGRLRPGGLLMIADFATPKGGVLARALHFLYYRAGNVSFWLLTGNALHPAYDYRSLAEDRGLTHRQTIGHRLFPGGPEYFQTLVLAKPDS